MVTESGTGSVIESSWQTFELEILNLSPRLLSASASLLPCSLNPTRVRVSLSPSHESGSLQ